MCYWILQLAQQNCMTTIPKFWWQITKAKTVMKIWIDMKTDSFNNICPIIYINLQSALIYDKIASMQNAKGTYVCNFSSVLHDINPHTTKWLTSFKAKYLNEWPTRLPITLLSIRYNIFLIVVDGNNSHHNTMYSFLLATIWIILTFMNSTLHLKCNSRKMGQMQPRGRRR